MKSRMFISGMHCTSCSMLIEGELEDMGVSASVNYAKQVVDVDYDPVKTPIGTITATIQRLGYVVQRVE